MQSGRTTIVAWGEPSQPSRARSALTVLVLDEKAGGEEVHAGPSLKPPHRAR
jgi:hypothetical protein